MFCSIAYFTTTSSKIMLIAYPLTDLSDTCCLHFLFYRLKENINRFSKWILKKLFNILFKDHYMLISFSFSIGAGIKPITGFIKSVQKVFTWHNPAASFLIFLVSNLQYQLLWKTFFVQYLILNCFSLQVLLLSKISLLFSLQILKACWFDT